MLRSVVVVGGGIAATSTVAALRDAGYDGRLTLLEAGPAPYDRPPLSKDYLLGTATRDDLLLQQPGWWAERAVDLRTGVRAERLPDGDAVVLATGGSAALPDALAGTRTHVLRTVEDADRLREALQPGARVLVVGGGLIGAEVASAAAARRCAVTLADPVPAPLAPVLGPRLAGWLHGVHAQRGIALRGEPVTTTHGWDVVVVGVGMVPVTALAAGLDRDRGVLVDAQQRTSDPRVLAVGDVAQRRGAAAPAGHWDAAAADGRRAAAALLGRPAPPPTTPWFWSDRHGLHVQVVGEVGDLPVVVRGTFGEPPFTVLAVQDGRLVAAASVSDGPTFAAARKLVDRRVAVTAAQLADAGVDLRRLR